MLLGGMLMVKMGVSDRQQAPPSYPFVVQQILLIDQDVHVCGIFGGSGTPLRSFPSLASF